jgi:membrane dipeptidase
VTSAPASPDRGLLDLFPLVDGHNDLPWEIRQKFGGDLSRVDLGAPVPGLHTDLPRLRQGGVGAQFWSVYVPGTLQGEAALAATLEQIDLAHRIIRQHPGTLELALTADDVTRIFSQGKVASLLGAEGGHSIAGSMGVLRMLYRLGVRYLTLTHNYNVPWADSATDEPVLRGLSAFGHAVVREMQRIGMLVDLSHTAADTARDALRIADAPMIFSHSCARALCDHPRNVPDDVLSRLRDNGGVCMVAFVPAFVSAECHEWDLALAAEMRSSGLDPKNLAERNRARVGYAACHPRPQATLAQVADHVEHVRAVAGVEHVGLGADYDGTDRLPQGLEDVSCYPALFGELRARGWSRPDLARLAGGNVLRALRAAEAAARAWSAQSTPAPGPVDDAARA